MTVGADPGVRLSRAGIGFPEWLRNPILFVVVRRVLLSLPLLFLVSALDFVLLSLTPGNAASTLLGFQATPEQIVKVEHALGLDHPVYTQYWHWLTRALSGDLGTSLITNQPVSSVLHARWPVSLSLIIGSLSIMLSVGLTVGIVSAVRGGLLGRVVDACSWVAFALPGFWVGAVLISIFAVRFRVFPAVGYVPFSQSPADWLRSLILPVIALSLPGIAIVATNVREAMLDVLASEHIRMAWASGVSPRSLFLIYALKPTAARVVTVAGLLTVNLLGGTVLIETVFALPGLGSSFASAITARDLPAIQGIAVFFTLIIVAVNLTVDLAYVWVDPRVRLR